LEHYGFELEGRPDGRLSCLCPFHADSRPSLDVFDEGTRIGCFPCGRTGDVIDLVSWLEGGLSFSQALAKSEELLQTFDTEAWERPVYEGVTLDPENIRAYLRWCWDTQDVNAWWRLCLERGWPFDPEVIRKRWNIVTGGPALVVVPYFTQDRSPYAYKTRTPGQPWIALTGASFPDFYGAWLDRGHEHVVLCEGESDTWSAWFALQGLPVDVVGLPTGAGGFPKQAMVERMRGRVVTIAFDGDPAGRAASGRWAATLVGISQSARIAFLPDGADLSSVVDIRTILREAR
jgi:hypothetical protein